MVLITWRHTFTVPRDKCPLLTADKTNKYTVLKHLKHSGNCTHHLILTLQTLHFDHQIVCFAQRYQQHSTIAQQATEFALQTAPIRATQCLLREHRLTATQISSPSRNEWALLAEQSCHIDWNARDVHVLLLPLLQLSSWTLCCPSSLFYCLPSPLLTPVLTYIHSSFSFFS
jgi:hypothetical protein